MLLKCAVVCLLIAPSPFVRADEHPEHDGHEHAANASAADKIDENLAQLSAEDRQLSQEQKYCPVMPEVVLGEMGAPIKIDVDGHAVMVCCKGCAKKAQSDPAATLNERRRRSCSAVGGPSCVRISRCKPSRRLRARNSRMSKSAIKTCKFREAQISSPLSDITV